MGQFEVAVVKHSINHMLLTSIVTLLGIHLRALNQASSYERATFVASDEKEFMGTSSCGAAIAAEDSVSKGFQLSFTDNVKGVTKYLISR